MSQTSAAWIPHVTVATIVFDAGRYLLVEELADGRQVLNQPAGHLEANESLIEAARRETLEESGWEVKIEAVLGASLFVAAVLGDSCNYYVGSRIGAAVYARDSRWIRRDHLDRAREFFERHGGKSVVIARFAPFLRTFVPFVAGASHMSYARFLMFNILGALFWVGGFVGLGYFFGNLPGVKEHFTWVLLGIIVLSLLPALVAYLQGRRPAAGDVRR